VLNFIIKNKTIAPGRYGGGREEKDKE